MALIDQIGGSFLIMTATLPGFYFNALQRELGVSKKELVYGEFIDDTVRRHHISLLDYAIHDEEIVEKMVQLGEVNKVLVICNTIDRSIQVYQKIKLYTDKVNLLHSRFIKKDRSSLEKSLLNFAGENEPGIWVTTQIVEASLDIDFDHLFTEMSSLDSQFQRYGRCNRKGKKSVDKVNVHVCMEDVSGVGYVYHKDIYNRSSLLLSTKQDGILLESEKHSMIKKTLR